MLWLVDCLFVTLGFGSLMMVLVLDCVVVIVCFCLVLAVGLLFGC